MPSKNILITGSSGLIGSEAVEHYCRKGWRVTGVDNNMRADFFGPGGDTRWISQSEERRLPVAQQRADFIGRLANDALGVDRQPGRACGRKNVVVMQVAVQ